MALVSGGRSTLNPNAPLFIPCYMRQVEDFSPEWWNLVTTSTWFREYWLSQHQGDVDGFFGNDEDGDVVDLLPDTIDIDLGVDEDILNMEAQYEEFLLSAEAGQGNNSSPLAVRGKPKNFRGKPKNFRGKPKNGLYSFIHKPNNGLSSFILSCQKFFARDAVAVLMNLSSSKERGPKSPVDPPKYYEKPAKYIRPKCSPRLIQQPR